MQAYDSVAVEADVELGGTDQLYNLLAGRAVMEAYGLDPQVVLTTPLLLSWDGAKMSSSVGNNIPLTAPAEEQFGKTMRISDELLPDWWRLVLEEEPPPGTPMECEARAGPAHRAPLSRGGCGACMRRRTSPGSCGRAELPRTWPRRRCPTATRCTCRRCWPRPSGCRPARRAGMISQGGVKVDGAPLDGARRPALRTCRDARPGGQAPLRAARGSRLTLRAPLLQSVEPPERAARSLQLDSQSKRLRSAFDRIGYDE